MSTQLELMFAPAGRVEVVRRPRVTSLQPIVGNYVWFAEAIKKGGAYVVTAYGRELGVVSCLAGAEKLALDMARECWLRQGAQK